MRSPHETWDFHQSPRYRGSARIGPHGPRSAEPQPHSDALGTEVQGDFGRKTVANRRRVESQGAAA